MYTFLRALAIASTSLLSSAADDRLSGEWKVRNEVAGNVSEMTCVFTLKGQDLTGNCVTEQATVEIAGTVEGANVAWVYRSVYEGNPITLRYTGTLGEAGTMAGTLLVEEFNVTGEFKAAAVKK